MKREHVLMYFIASFNNYNVACSANSIDETTTRGSFYFHISFRPFQCY